MSHAAGTATRCIARLRRAVAGAPLRGAILGMALLLAGMQLALRTHLIDHDQLLSGNQVCEQCVVAKAAPTPPSLAATLPPAADIEALSVATLTAPRHRTTPVERNRGPPAAS
jgi:hypothetical protein